MLRNVPISKSKPAEDRNSDSIIKALDKGDGTWMSQQSWEDVLPKAGKQSNGRRTFQKEPVWIDNKLPRGVWEIRKRLGKGEFKVLKRFKTST